MPRSLVAGFVLLSATLATPTARADDTVHAKPANPLAERLHAIDTLEPPAADPYPELGKTLHVETERFDVSTSLGKDLLLQVVRTAEKTSLATRLALGYGADDSGFHLRTFRIVVCAPGEYADFLAKIGTPKEQIPALSKTSTHRQGQFMLVRYDATDSTLSLDVIINWIGTALLQTESRTSGLRGHVWLVEGFGLYLSNLLQGTTMTLAVATTGGTAVATSGREAPYEGHHFNRRYVADLVQRGKDGALRAELGKRADALTVDDVAKAFLFLTWLVEVKDTEHSILRTWFEAFREGDEEAESRLATAWGLAKPPAYETLDHDWREWVKVTYAPTPTGAAKPKAK